MTETGVTDLEVLRLRLTDGQRAILNGIWQFYRDHGQWVPHRLLYQTFGKAVVLAALAQLGPNIIREIRENKRGYYRLTFLGVLLTDQGKESEELLARYLEYVRSRWKADPGLEWVGSLEVEAALGLTSQRSRLLRQLIRLSHWWGGGSGFGAAEWTVGVPVDVDDIPADSDLRNYLRDHVLRHFPTETSPGETRKPRREFWFVGDPDLRQRLAQDWHEAHAVHQVRGWKSCVLLCGAILQEILVDALAREAQRTGRPSPKGPEQRGLADLLEAARERGILGTGTPPLGRVLMEFRDFVRPGWQARERVEVTRDDAEAALNAVRACLRLLAATT